MTYCATGLNLIKPLHLREALLGLLHQNVTHQLKLVKLMFMLFTITLYHDTYPPITDVKSMIIMALGTLLIVFSVGVAALVCCCRVPVCW